MTKLTVCYVTGRKEPRLDWAFRSLNASWVRSGFKPDLDLIVIDALGRGYSDWPADLGLAWAANVGCRFLRPKPNIWQGPHRVTSRDLWAMSNARNTGFVHCKTDWIAFLDDRCVLEPTWMEAVLDAMAEGYVVCGAYAKRHNMSGNTIEEILASGTHVSQDNRLEAAPDGNRHTTGNWLYGCTFALPLEWALEVNGFEEGCDWLSGEDYIFGMTLYNAGYRIDFDPRMKIIEDRSPDADPGSATYKRDDKGVSPNDKSHAALHRFGIRNRTEFTPDLRALRALALAGEPLPAPDPNVIYKDWYDGQPISEL